MRPVSPNYKAFNEGKFYVEQEQPSGLAEGEEDFSCFTNTDD